MIGEENNSTNTSNIRHVLPNNASDTFISDTTPSILGTPDINTTRIIIEQHPTPKIVHLTVNENTYEEGYDSDGQIELFLMQ